MSTPVLKLEGVSKTYPGVRALDQVSIDCLPGEVHAILGENGSGKSTLMKIASGVVRPDSGVVEIAGQRLANVDPRTASGLGLSTVYQDDSLVLELTVAQNLFMASRQGTVRFAEMNAWAATLLSAYGVSIAPDALIADLSPAQRQFVEIVKALQSEPMVLLFDEPTSTLDADGVRKLTGIIRNLTARGTGIIYVSHRLPEILELADRVTVLRDGVHQGTFAVTESLSEHDLITLMVGRDIDVEYAAKATNIAEDPVLVVKNLAGKAFQDISFSSRKGEILGFAGAEGNGQREVLRALAGLEEAHGTVECMGLQVSTASPRSALESGLLFLSSDRKGEAIFPELSIGKNMILPLLDKLTSFGLLSRKKEQATAAAMKRDFGVAAADLSLPVIQLSGGNQQKAVLARSFRSDAKAFLIDEPTQGVDAGARFEIYKAIRENIQGDGTCIVNSSDAQELAGICDRVLVFSRGRIVRELVGEAITEENIVGSFLMARDARQTKNADAATETPIFLQQLTGGSASWWVPLLFLLGLIAIVSVYAAANSNVFLKPINFRHLLLALTPVAIVAMAQLHALLIKGIDVSVGSLMSMVVVAMSFLIVSGTSSLMIAGTGACLLLGVATGLANGTLVRFGRINPVITTIATLSILQGLALVGRPTPAGIIDGQFTSLLRTCIGFLPVATIFVVIAALISDYWLHRTRSGLLVKATGFREEAARRNGAPVTWIHLRAYILAGVSAAIAGMFLGAQVGVGHPSVGQNYALSSIAAAVLGGAALTGGRGSFSGALLGAFFFTLMTNVISVLGLNSAFGVIASGTMTLFAIVLYSGVSGFDRLVRIFARSRREAKA
ncbi:ATP-binding cassette domain-containing protein (plasmid) [Sinorhizobium chiapasense]|uniref:ATP-binding cassette domain-containing protein n=1 Tax=Sinorhizobium chiapasense TaxID=501572 RepID=UPI002FE33070